MSIIETTQIERHPDGKIVYSVRSQFEQGRIEFSVAIQDTGTEVENEAAVLLFTRHVAEDLIESIRPRLDGRTL